MRLYRWGILGLLVVWLIALARREAHRRGRPSLGFSVLLAGGGVLSFLAAIGVQNRELSQILVVAALILIVAALAAVLWQGFGSPHHK